MTELQAALEELAAALKKVEGLLDELRAQRDPLASHVFVARRQFSVALENDNKSGKRSEREARGSWQTACDLGYRGSLGEWRRLLGAMPTR